MIEKSINFFSKYTCKIDVNIDNKKKLIYFQQRPHFFAMNKKIYRYIEDNLDRQELYEKHISLFNIAKKANQKLMLS